MAPRPLLLPLVHLSQAKKRQKRKEIRQEGRADSTQTERGDLKGFVPPAIPSSRLLVLMRHKKAIKDAEVSERENMGKVEVGGDGGHRGESRHA